MLILFACSCVLHCTRQDLRISSLVSIDLIPNEHPSGRARCGNKLRSSCISGSVQLEARSGHSQAGLLPTEINSRTSSITIRIILLAAFRCRPNLTSLSGVIGVKFCIADHGVHGRLIQASLGLNFLIHSFADSIPALVFRSYPLAKFMR